MISGIAEGNEFAYIRLILDAKFGNDHQIYQKHHSV